MSWQELMDAYRKAIPPQGDDDGKDIGATMRYKEILQAHLQPEFDEVHYQLLRQNRGTLLYRVTLAEFKKRPNAAPFLLATLPTENDPEMRADILQILGGMECPSSLPLAREFLSHNHPRHREVALYVLGWVGGANEIPLLRKHMLEERESLLRRAAVTAHSQIAFRRPPLKKQLIDSLRAGFRNETDLEVLPWIIIEIGTIASKKLGLSEKRKAPGNWSGDFEKARKRTAAFLETL